jgi:hypothetical protein
MQDTRHATRTKYSRPIRRAAERPTRKRRLMAKKSRRRPDHRRVKLHRSYSIDEVARLFGMHKNTVRGWIGQGLPLLDRGRPQLIHGTDLIGFLKRRRARNRRPCGPGQIYCVKCRSPQAPAGDVADYAARTRGTGDLIGLCPTCETLIYRRVSLQRLDQIRGNLEVQIVQPHLPIADGSFPSVNCDFQPGAISDAT